jgi:hypothetical protein
MSDAPNALDKKCGSCARFVRVSEIIDANGEIRRAGQCLLGVWPSPLYETSTCSQYVKRGTYAGLSSRGGTLLPAPKKRGFLGSPPHRGLAAACDSRFLRAKAW